MDIHAYNTCIMWFVSFDVCFILLTTRVQSSSLFCLLFIYLLIFFSIKKV